MNRQKACFYKLSTTTWVISVLFLFWLFACGWSYDLKLSFRVSHYIPVGFFFINRDYRFVSIYNIFSFCFMHTHINIVKCSDFCNIAIKNSSYLNHYLKSLIYTACMQVIRYFNMPLLFYFISSSSAWMSLLIFNKVFWWIKNVQAC